MSKTLFQAKATPIAAADTGNGLWELEVSIVDLAAIFTAYDVRVGDIFILDTTGWETGTYTSYVIKSITSILTPTSIKCIVQYDSSNDNDDPLVGPDSAVGIDGMICRPTSNQKLLPAIAPGVQRLSDAFSAFITNYNLSKKIDNAPISNSQKITIDGNGTYLELPYSSKSSGSEKTRTLKIVCLIEGVKLNQEVSCTFENTVHISKSGQIVLEQNDFTSKSPGSESIMLEAISNQNKTTIIKLSGIAGCVGTVDISVEEFLGA